jgi:hypothetical protein
MEDLDRLKRIDENRAGLLEAMKQMQSHFEGIPPEEIEAEIEKTIAEVETERRKQREALAWMASWECESSSMSISWLLPRYFPEARWIRSLGK